MSHHSHKLLHLLTLLRKVRAKYYPKRGCSAEFKEQTLTPTTDVS